MHNYANNFPIAHYYYICLERFKALMKYMNGPTMELVACSRFADAG